MKIYKIERKEVDYDEFNGFVIAANSKEEVIQLAIKDCVKYLSESYETEWRNAKLIKVGDYTGKRANPFILLDSFNAAE